VELCQRFLVVLHVEEDKVAENPLECAVFEEGQIADVSDVVLDCQLLRLPSAHLYQFWGKIDTNHPCSASGKVSSEVPFTASCVEQAEPFHIT
jgi:hypothetical protein